MKVKLRRIKTGWFCFRIDTKKKNQLKAWCFLCPVHDHKVIECPSCYKTGNIHYANPKIHHQLVCNRMFLNYAKNRSDKKCNEGSEVKKLTKYFSTLSLVMMKTNLLCLKQTTWEQTKAPNCSAIGRNPSSQLR